MKKENFYKIENIKVGDEVIFYSTNQQSNRDLYWRVTGKEGNQIYIELKEMGWEEYWTISIDEVEDHIPTSKK